MNLFTKLNVTVRETKRIVEIFSNTVKKNVGMDVCIDCSVMLTILAQIGLALMLPREQSLMAKV